MHVFRGKFTRYVVILLMGLTFLNVSFLQMEIRFLKQVTGNYLSLSILVEVLEEKAVGETEDDLNDKEAADVIFHASNEHSYHSILHSQNMKWLALEAALHRGYLKKFSPPPEA
jgi:hypothetical protein